MCAGTITGLAGFGDSLTDEYSTRTFNYAKNWYEQVTDLRGVMVGDQGDWGEPRLIGFEFNWARAGATTSDILAIVGNFHHGPLIQDQIRSGRVSHATLFAGANDFGPWRDPYGAIYRGSWSSAEIKSYQNTVVDNVEEIVEELQAAGARVVLASPSDFGLSPFTRANTSYTDPVARQRVTDVMQNVDDRLRQVAAQNGIPFVDMFAFGERVFGTQAMPNSLLLVGGVPIQVLQAGVAPTNGFVDDGIHYHTVIQGLMANLFLEALRQGYGSDVPLLAEEEIVHAANLTFEGNSLNFAASDFVSNYVTRWISAPLLARAAYAVLDNDSDSVFDDLGDTVNDRSSAVTAGIGEIDLDSNNSVGRLIAKFALPDRLGAIDHLQSATLRFFVEGIERTPAGPLSLLHSLSDNDLDLLATDYEDASYTDTLLDLVQPTDSPGMYYELDVTDLVLADYASDGADPLSAFRLQINEATFFEDNLSKRYLLTMPGAETDRPQLVLTFILEPPTSILAAMALLGVLGWGRNRKNFTAKGVE
jgi:hypothetical protein